MPVEIRQPKQERSIETKNKIINSAYKLFSEVGYHSTTTALIAKNAEVSTGIVYGYFLDKRAILLDVLELYINKVFQPINAIFDNITLPVDFSQIIEEAVKKTIEIHQENAQMHTTLHSLTGTDEEVNRRFVELEDNLTKQIAEKLTALGLKISNVNEKIHLAMNVIQSFAHESVYDMHDYIDYPAMQKIVCQLLVNLFKS
ncbi:MAG: TetR/AcrR family transcriptional regulator [Clostridiales bacterium]|nr:TetR/AcrR family transcriptional regulator [Clostridiales bacterium]MDY5725811.1 TetR/AcrR family transcriptional regulator [Eubacteriales bacterium]